MSASEWFGAGVDLLLGLVQLAIMAAWLILMWQIVRIFLGPWVHRRGQRFPSPKIMVRRMWCKHRFVARIRDPYGRHYTACGQCGIDVNQGKPREEWR